MSNYHNHPSGFSLIEVLISTAIIALGLIAVVAVMPLSLKVNKSAERASLASSYGRAKIEQILTLPYDEVNTGNLESQVRLSLIPTNPAYIMFRTTTVNYVDNNLVDSLSDSGLKKVMVTITWSNQQGGSESLVFTSLLSNK